MNEINLKKLKVSSEKTFEKLIRWGWMDASGSQVLFEKVNKVPRAVYTALEEVDDPEEADVIQIGGKIYPVKEREGKGGRYQTKKGR